VNLNNLVSIPAKKGRIFSGYLACLETGRVWSLKSNKWLKATVAVDKYLKLTLYDDTSKPYSTFFHRVVLSAKIQSWDYHECEHRDGNPANNCADNLEPLYDHKSQYDERVRNLISQSRLGEKNVRSIFTDKQVRQILIDFNNYVGAMCDFITIKRAEYNCEYMPLYCICTRRTWKHIDIHESNQTIELLTNLWSGTIGQNEHGVV
jgi:hypothetical protein